MNPITDAIIQNQKNLIDVQRERIESLERQVVQYEAMVKTQGEIIDLMDQSAREIDSLRLRVVIR